MRINLVILWLKFEQLSESGVSPHDKANEVVTNDQCDDQNDLASVFTHTFKGLTEFHTSVIYLKNIQLISTTCGLGFLCPL